MPRRLSLTFFMAAFAGFFAVPIFAQSDTAGLFGLVRDTSVSAIAGAKVKLTNLGTGAVREQQTDVKGLYHFDLLPPGNYELVVEATGFKQFRDSAVKMEVAQVARLNAQLEIGTANEFVEVQGAATALTTENVAQGTIVGEQKIVQLPLNGRQFIQLALLVPGASSGGRQVQQNQVRLGQIGGLSVAGNRTNNTNFLLDGALNLDPDYSSLNYSPQIDSVSEFQVQTAMVSAEYSRASINIASKQGSNEFHGTAFEFLRNKALDARPFNAPGDLPKFQRNQYGGTLGGPIKRSKLFAFLAFEGLRVRQAGSGLTTVSVPTAQQRAGDFSQTRGGIFDPDTLAAGIRQQFPGNVIPVTRINPLSQTAMKAMPAPTDALRGTFENTTGILKQNNDNYSGRLDYNLTKKWTVFSRYSLSNEDALVPNTVTDRDQLSVARSRNAVLGATGVLKANLVNEARFGFNRLRLLSGLPEPAFYVGGTATALPAFLPAGYPTMGGTGGYLPTVGGGIFLVRDSTFQVYDTLSWTHGSHNVKFGGEVYWLQYNRIEAPNTLGNYQFTNGFTTRTARADGTGDALASMLLGLPAVANRAVGPSRIDGRQRVLSAYVQDDYKLRPNLTLNLGVRYEYAPPVWDAHQQMSSIDYSNVPGPQAIFANGPLATYKPTLFICGQGGTPRGCAYTDKNNFAPRVGIVYSPGSKWVVRAGGGMFYSGSDGNPLFRLAAGLPGNIAQTLSSDNFIPRFQGFDIFGPAVVGPSQIQAAGIDINQRTSYTLQWNFSVQRELGKNMVVEASYLATLGLKLEQNVQPNNAQPGLGAVDPRRPYLGVTYAPGTVFPSYVNVVGNSVPVGFINYLPRSAQSNYHALLIRVERRFSHGLSFLGSYTFSKAITNAPQFRNAGGVAGSENSPAQDAFNLAAERGLASFHNSHRWVNTFLYDLPVPKNKGLFSKAFGDIQLSGIFSFQTGFPITLNLRGDTAGVGAGTGGIFVRPNYVPGQPLGVAKQTTSQFFNTAAYAAPAAATFGNVGKNTVIGPGLANIDFVLAKNISVVERVKIQLRAEFFNSMNHPNWNIVGRIVNDPTFGRVVNQLDPRQIQFGIKIIF